jgi:hypothetical protein
VTPVSVRAFQTTSRILRASSSHSPRRSADDSGTVESEEALGTDDRAPQLSWARGGRWASAAADCLSRQRLRRSSRLTSRNLGEPINNRPFTLLLGSTSCGNRPVRRANPFNHLRALVEFKAASVCPLCAPSLPVLISNDATGKHGVEADVDGVRADVKRKRYPSGTNCIWRIRRSSARPA